jgi:death-on-curing protein
MRYLSLPELLELHEAIISETGGSRGIRDMGALESAINQPRLTFDQTDLYSDVISKAAALCHSLIMNHPFLDGNKKSLYAIALLYNVYDGFLSLHGTKIRPNTSGPYER